MSESSGDLCQKVVDAVSEITLNSFQFVEIAESEDVSSYSLSRFSVPLSVEKKVPFLFDFLLSRKLSRGNTGHVCVCNDVRETCRTNKHRKRPEG